MNTWFFYIVLLFLNLRSLTNVTQRNILKIEAGKAYTQKNYDLAANKYEYLAKISFNLEPEARLNLAHSYFNANDMTKALIEYKKLLRVSDKNIISSALIQIGVIDVMRGDSIIALGLFKEALQKDNQNKTARYNYELLKKKVPQNQPPINTNQNNQNENQANNGGETEKSEKKIDELDSTIPQKMSKEKALQILEAMKATELQYSQQQKYKGSNKTKVEKDW
ncbi:hypothetical protein EMA8858_01359 [Emticicia aquatica]|jgi:tetratricopeptide (TPR) repeat protein|uniref:Tetratricopeptide repeat protein n=1 Tax=Emticicia aquatica TaxID=1681835 RepID=A0ABM9AN38_9BACT|nr:hypothetical protein [Emticicia aquatica]CAH0995239.1 hypothetical protein EMA8858_01359 [Emticicia aquatica]